MFDLTTFKKEVRNFLLADTNLSTAVGGRIYFADLFSLVNPTFPLVNIELFEGRNLTPAVDRVGLNVYCTSRTTYQEADEIFDLLNVRLNNAHIAQRMVARSQITPFNRLVQLAFPAYQNISRYTIFYIG